MDDVTVDADEQMLPKLDHALRLRDAGSKRIRASEESAAYVLSEAMESVKDKCAEFECDEGTVSFCDSSAGEQFPSWSLCPVDA